MIPSLMLLPYGMMDGTTQLSGSVSGSTCVAWRGMISATVFCLLVVRTERLCNRNGLHIITIISIWQVEGMSQVMSHHITIILITMGLPTTIDVFPW